MMNRRTFLKRAAWAGPLVLSPNVLGLKKPGANERLNIGLIGLGGRCQWIVEKSYPDVQGMRIVAACDCLKPRLDGAMKNIGAAAGWTPYLDFREMIEKENLDGVMVETSTHQRAWVACHAMAMDMDVYIEKPMALTIGEGRDMVNIARKYKRVTQVGTQQRSIPMNNWACDLVQSGAIGKVKEVHAPNFTSARRWVAKPGQPLPKGATEKFWDLWTNQAEFRPYHEDIHIRWNHWWDYDGGGRSFGVTGWGTHSFDQIQRGLGTSETGPVEVVLEEEVQELALGAYEKREYSPQETGTGYYGGPGETGLRAKVNMTYADGTKLLLHLDRDRGPGLGCIFVGEKGRIEVCRDEISANPEELIASPERPKPQAIEETSLHIMNWGDCIKSRERCRADIEYGQRSTTLCYLVNIARDLGRVGEALKWDPKAERFSNTDGGNAMLSRPRRKGYELPS
jgi:hypothetical protein